VDRLASKAADEPQRRSADRRAQRQAVYTPVLEFKDRTARKRFQQVALQAVRALIGEGIA